MKVVSGGSSQTTAS